MRAWLMFRDRDVDPAAPLPPHAETLVQDLELTTLLDAMADGDAVVREAARRALLLPLGDPAAIAYRQDALADALAHPAVVRALYAIAVEAIRQEHTIWGHFSRSPQLLVHRSVQVLELFVPLLHRLRDVASAHRAEFRSDAFVRLFTTLEAELDAAFFDQVGTHLERVRFSQGVLMSASLGDGARGTRYVIRTPVEARDGWLRRLLRARRSWNTFEIAERDEAGTRYLSELLDRGIDPVAAALARSADHILAFFTALRTEIAFYVGGANLHGELARRGDPVCRPTPHPSGPADFVARGLYDVCLALRLPRRVVPNDLVAKGKPLVVITGANQGGKSTFLRSVGVAQLMMQCGLYVAADRLDASVVPAVFTHFKRKEDASMVRGKLEEELARMSEVVRAVSPGSLVLCNESFASTNEREGSEIARQVIAGLRDSGARVVFVTFLYDLTQGLYRESDPRTLFLRAERLEDGRRTYRIEEGEPLATSYGRDLFDQVFGAEPPPAPAPGRGPTTAPVS
jgi:hypothetical protein